MKDDKKPDNVVFNPETKTYDAALKPYSTSVGAPVITTTDNISWKNRSINKINHKAKAKYLELQEEYKKMIEEFKYNKLIFDAKFTFEPIVGETYHLYKRDNGETFLSIIAPEQCNFNAIGSFYLNVDQTWKRV